MNIGLTPPDSQVRCGTCRRLLFCAEPDAIAAAIRIKCPRCKALNILRPDRAPTIERPARQTERRDACPPRRPPDP
ncbi:MAG: Com family DNA-binding transcriptional regulator [Rhodobacteraceae bacterium]|nr:Com family DNA-binding transcriptional regulator [Paracoccaceae bacterium]